MKVLYLHQHFTTPEGTGGTRSYEIAKRLCKEGHSVTVVCGMSSKLPSTIANRNEAEHRVIEVDGVKILSMALPYSNKDSIFRRSLTFLKYSWLATRLGFQNEYDLVVATSTPLTVAIPGILLKAFKKTKFVFEVRDLWPELPKELGVIKNPIILFLLSTLEKVAYKSADGLIALAPGIRDGIIAICPEKTVAVIPNGCDFDIFDKKAQGTPGPISAFNGKFVAIYAGTHGIANGLEILIETANILHQSKRDDIVIVMVGDGGKKAELVAKAKQYNLDNLVFLDSVPKYELASLFRFADVGLQILRNVPAFYRGTSPNKFFDYISSGLPVLINYPGWVAEMIENNGIGYVVVPEMPEALARQLIHASDSRGANRVLGERAKSFARENFDRENLAAEWIEYVEKI